MMTMAKGDDTQRKKNETVALESNTSRTGLRNPARSDDADNDEGGFDNPMSFAPKATRTVVSDQQPAIRARNVGGNANSNNANINQEPDQQDEEESKKIFLLINK